jgi:cobalt/nickel transport system permease protein
MHMADALLSPATGATMWLAAGSVMAWSSRRLRAQADDRLVPLMGMLGAFVFAAQMINFSIPATGSSGHIGGGLLLAILLGPHAAFVVIASVLTVQALFFADGGLLALGANLFNLGVLPCLVAYPLVYRPLAGSAPTPRRTAIAAVMAAVVSLQLGALAVVLQTVASGISNLPLAPFLGLMLPIHAAIGVVEGLATAALLLFLRRARPELLDAARGGPENAPLRRGRIRQGLLALGLTTLLLGGVLSWFASPQPDGLEWSLAHAAEGEVAPPSAPGLHARLAALQQSTAWLPGYGWPAVEHAAVDATAATSAAAAWPAVDAATSLAGVLGGVLTLALVTAVSAIALGLRRRRSRA